MRLRTDHSRGVNSMVACHHRTFGESQYVVVATQAHRQSTHCDYAIHKRRMTISSVSIQVFSSDFWCIGAN